MMQTAKSMCHNEKPEHHNKEPVQPKNNSKKGIEQELEGFVSEWGGVGSCYSRSPAEATSGSAGDKG